MPLISRIKDVLYTQALRKYRGTNLGKATADHFENIRSVGIVFDAMASHDRDIVLEYQDLLLLNGKDVAVLGFFNSKIEGLSFQFDFIDQKNLSFAGIPKGENVQKFIQTPFDVLINLDLSDHKPVNYICAASYAIFKVGPAHGNPAHYDLMIEMHERDLKKYLEQIRITFNKING